MRLVKEDKDKAQKEFKLPRPIEVVDFQFRQMIENLPV